MDQALFIYNISGIICVGHEFCTFITGRYPERKISEDWWHKTGYTNRSTLWESPRYFILTLYINIWSKIQTQTTVV